MEALKFKKFHNAATLTDFVNYYKVKVISITELNEGRITLYYKNNANII